MGLAIMEKKVFEMFDVSYSCLGKFPALCGVNLEIREGEKVALLGANGSGKSTLLHILNGLAFPQKGEIRFLGHSLTEEAFKDEEFNQFFRKAVGLVFQNSDVQLFSTTVWDEIAFGPIQLELPREEIEERINDLLKMLGMERLRDRVPYQLSGGEKKKVAIAATLAVNPDVLLLDEPINGLDPRTKAWFVELLEELHIAGKTIVTATHDLEILERMANRAIVMGEDHAITFEGRTSEILENRPLLLKVNLLHEHIHCHDDVLHSHSHGHFSEHDHIHRNTKTYKEH